MKKLGVIIQLLKWVVLPEVVKKVNINSNTIDEQSDVLVTLKQNIKTQLCLEGLCT